MNTSIEVTAGLYLRYLSFRERSNPLTLFLQRGRGIRSPLFVFFVITFDWVVQFCWNLLNFPKVYMELIFWKMFFGIARIFQLVVGSKPWLMLNFLKYTCIIYRWTGNYLEITNIRPIILCIQQAKSNIKAILSKIFKQNVDYTKVDQFSALCFKNDDVTKKQITSSKHFYVKW